MFIEVACVHFITAYIKVNCSNDIVASLQAFIIVLSYWDKTLTQTVEPSFPWYDTIEEINEIIDIIDATCYQYSELTIKTCDRSFTNP